MNGNAGLPATATEGRVTANLQTELTVKQAAELTGVSERMVYLARRLAGLGCPDLVQQCRDGTLSLNKALEIAEGRKPPTSWDRLVRVWNAATDDDRGRFIIYVRALVKESES